MRTWIHFIGKSYYTEKSFIAEAEHYGITRRVSLQVLKRMEYGDRVVMAMAERTRAGARRGRVMGMFFIDGISGLSKEASAALVAAGLIEKVDDGGARVKRGCGSYTTGASYKMKDNEQSMAEITHVLDDCEDPGKLMVMGKYCEHDSVILENLSHFQGFRPFDYDKFMRRVAEARPKYKRAPVVRGQFYATHSDSDRAVSRIAAKLQEVNAYARKETEKKDKAAGKQSKLHFH